MMNNLLSSIPNDWSLKSLEEVSKVSGGKRMPKGKDLIEANTGHPYIRVTNMKENGLIQDNLLYVPKEVSDKISRYTIHTGDLYISVAGTLGLVGKIPPELDGANLTENANRISEIICNPDYLLYILRSNLIQKHIESEKTISAQPKLALTRIRKFDIPIPPLKEQQKIAAILSSVDEAIEKTEQIIEQTERVKKGLMQELLTKGIGHTEFKDSVFGEIPLSWKVKSLGDLLIEKPSYGSGNAAQSFNKKLPRYIRITDISEEGVLLNEDIKSVALEGNEKYILTDGDLLFARTGNTVGKSYLYNEKDGLAVYAGYLIRFKLSNEIILPKFVFHFTHSGYYYNWVKSMLRTGAQPNINAQEYSSLMIPIPPIEEQKIIDKKLSFVEQKIMKENDKLISLHSIKQGLMQQLLTGKKRVKVDDNEEVLS